LVKNGDTVVAGQVLLRLDDTNLRSELTIIEGQLFAIHARKALLGAERDGSSTMTVPKALAEVLRQHPEVQSMIDGHRRLFDARLESLQRETDQILEQIDQGHNQIEGTSAQLAAFKTQQDLISKELTDAQALLAKGLTQAARVSSLQREQARLLGEIGNLVATIAQLRGQIAALGIQQIKLATTQREEANTTLSDLQYREIELAERRLALHETLSRMAIRSPVAGVIYGPQVFALQAVISPAAPIMYIIPQDQHLGVSARIQAINIDQFYVGQAASLCSTAFEQRSTPEILGRAARISEDVFSDDSTGLSLFQAELLPDAAELDKLGGKNSFLACPLKPLSAQPNARR
jgi:HlyD family type I secretion membrane fusion protein